MLRGLVIRQLFGVLDILLLVLVAGAAYLFIERLLAKPGPPPLVAPVFETEAEGVKTVSLASRDVYDAIIKSGLFGDAGRQGGASEKTEQPVEIAAAPVVPTTLPLRLLGTAAAHPTDPLGTAVIENSSPSVRGVKTYYLHQPVLDQVELVEIHSRKVILLNKTNNTKEELSLDAPATGMGGPAVTPASIAPTRSAPGQVTLKRQEVMDQLTKDYGDLMSKLNPQLYKDASGKVSGVTAANLSTIPLAQKIGLKDNDVLQSVNGVKIENEQSLADIAKRFSNSNSFWLSVLRDGKPQMINFKLE